MGGQDGTVEVLGGLLRGVQGRRPFRRAGRELEGLLPQAAGIAVISQLADAALRTPGAGLRQHINHATVQGSELARP